MTVAATNVSGARYGVYATNLATGAISVTTTGAVSGGSNTGVVVKNTAATGGALSVNTAGVTGAVFGILAQNAGLGATSVTSTALVTGGSASGVTVTNVANSIGGIAVTTAAVTGANRGIDAQQYGSGALSVTANGTVTGTASVGLLAVERAGTNLTVNAVAVTGKGRAAIDTYNYGTGTTTVTATGAVNGQAGYGLEAENKVAGTGALTVRAAQVTGFADGIHAINRGSNALSVTATG